MCSRRNDSRVQRSVSTERPNYLRYGDIFMTAARKPVNCIRNPRIEDSEQYGLSSGNSFRFSSPTHRQECNRLHPLDEGSCEQLSSRGFSAPRNIQQEILRNNDPDYDEIDPQDGNLHLRKTDFSRQGIDRFGTGEDVPDYIMPASQRQNVRMQRQQLPQLQWRRNTNNDYNWDDIDNYESRRKRSKYSLFFPAVWQKFVITFTSLLSLICLTWIAYNWKSSEQTNSVTVIKPEKSFFKVLPDAPGGADAYQYKGIYNRVDPHISINQQERLIPPTEEPGELPMPQWANDDTGIGEQQSAKIQNYTIIDDRDYYIKCKKDANAAVTKNQVTAIRNNLNRFENQNVLQGISCSVRKVANTQGQLGEYILIGPFHDYLTAGKIGKFCGLSGEIITVQKKEN